MMFTPHAKMPVSDLSYGYGWYIGEMNNHNVVGHGGRIEGFITELWRYTDDKVTIIVISNRDSTGVGNIANLVAQAVFEKQ